ncbi:hypothetical protein ACH4NO_01650 [Streptomyces olivaceus]|nr:hypothetical protein [Streptomyces olivaceus]MBZ6101426.1 hypothetical protein [Streptomyces olivaceus]
MSDTRTPPTEPGAALPCAARFFQPGTAAPEAADRPSAGRQTPDDEREV